MSNKLPGNADAAGGKGLLITSPSADEETGAQEGQVTGAVTHGQYSIGAKIQPPVSRPRALLLPTALSSYSAAGLCMCGH